MERVNEVDDGDPDVQSKLELDDDDMDVDDAENE